MAPMAFLGGQHVFALLWQEFDTAENSSQPRGDHVQLVQLQIWLVQLEWETQKVHEVAFQALPFRLSKCSLWVLLQVDTWDKSRGICCARFLFLFEKCRNVWLSGKVNTSAEQRVGGRVTDLLLGLEDEMAAEGRGRRRRIEVWHFSLMEEQ